VNWLSTCTSVNPPVTQSHRAGWCPSAPPRTAGGLGAPQFARRSSRAGAESIALSGHDSRSPRSCGCRVRESAWCHPCRAVDQFEQVIDVLLSEKRDAAPARRFFTLALRQAPRPAKLATDKAPAYLGVLDELLPGARHVTAQYRVEADHGWLKARLRPADEALYAAKAAGRITVMPARVADPDSVWAVRAAAGPNGAP
jgi:hypothetical protein